MAFVRMTVMLGLLFGVASCQSGAPSSSSGLDGSSAADGSVTRCAVDERVSGGVCVSCSLGTTNAAGDDASGGDTTCDATLCATDEHVSGHACVPCAAGSNNVAGDDASGADTSCDGALCPSNQHVVSHACTACPPGTTNAVGDDASGADTACDSVLCASNQRVVSHACSSCPAGTTNAAGDDASGGDTTCDTTLCATDEHVSGHACVPCAAGSNNVAGDDASGADTSCDGALCPSNQHVVSHACTACPAGTTNAVGDDASGADTACDSVLCASNQRVVSHACTACPAGTTNAAGDDASAGDTTCDATLCATDEHVSSHACVPCASGSDNMAGDDASGADTSCDGVLCPSNQHVVSHTCTACPGGSTNAAGDDASGSDTACDTTYCAINEHVVSHGCVGCGLGGTQPAGDPATGPDTACTYDTTGPSYTYTPNRAFSLLRPDDVLRFSFSEATDRSAPVFTGNLASAASAAWQDAQTLVVTPTTAWPLGAASLSFTVYDVYGNPTLVAITGIVTDAIYVHPSGSNSNPGTATAPVLDLYTGLARAMLLAPAFSMRVAVGDYNGSGMALGDVSLDGGYSATDWSVRSNADDYKNQYAGYSNASNTNNMRTAPPKTWIYVNNVFQMGAAGASSHVDSCVFDYNSGGVGDAQLTALDGDVTIRHSRFAHLDAYGNSVTVEDSWMWNDVAATTIAIYDGAATLSDIEITGGPVWIGPDAGALNLHDSAIWGAPGLQFVGGTQTVTHQITNTTFLAIQSTAVTFDGSAGGSQTTINVDRSTFYVTDTAGQAINIDGSSAVSLRVADSTFDSTGVTIPTGHLFPSFPLAGSPNTIDVSVTGPANIELLRDHLLGAALGVQTNSGQGDPNITFVGNFFESSVSEAIGVYYTGNSGTIEIVGNTFRLDTAGTAFSVGTNGTDLRFDLNNVIAPGGTGVLSGAGQISSIRWNNLFASYPYVDMTGVSGCDSGCDVNQLNALPSGGGFNPLTGGNIFIDPVTLALDTTTYSPTSSTPCSFTQSTANASALVTSNDLVAYGGTARTSPYSIGAYEWDGTCSP